MIGARRYRVAHRTAYDYGAEMADGYSVATLLSRPTPTQQVVESQLVTTPTADEYERSVDAFGNNVVQLGIHRPHRSLDVDVTTEVLVTTPEMPRVDPTCSLVSARLEALRDNLALEVSPYLASSRFVRHAVYGAELRRLAADVVAPNRTIVESVTDLCTMIFQTFAFDPTATDVSTPLEDVMAARSGVCQDFAHLAVGVLRANGLAARYVSGYIETDPPPGEPKTIGADASHAWCSAWIPDHGWLDFDPTNGLVGPDRHVTVGWGRDYADVAPLRGLVIGPSSPQTLTVSVDVARIE